MKKYLLGLSAIVLAIGFSAFTKPTKMFANASFKYDFTSSYAKADVEAIDHWIVEPSTLSCPSDLVKACGLVVSDTYYHLNDEGSPVLNDEAFIALPLNQRPNDQTDAVMTIEAEQGTGATGIFRVKSSVNTTGTPDNRD